MRGLSCFFLLGCVLSNNTKRYEYNETKKKSNGLFDFFILTPLASFASVMHVLSNDGSIVKELVFQVASNVGAPLETDITNFNNVDSIHGFTGSIPANSTWHDYSYAVMGHGMASLGVTLGGTWAQGGMIVSQTINSDGSYNNGSCMDGYKFQSGGCFVSISNGVATVNLIVSNASS